MSFTGDLEHLPIVDIMQLLHAARKCGTLSVKGNNRENKITFKNGCIISADTSGKGPRLGKILVEMQAITSGVYDQATAGPTDRKSLALTLLENRQVKPEAVCQSLEKLVENLVLEVLTWQKGTFSLDVDRIEIADEYQYFIDQGKGLEISAQSVLLEALRIYDEKMRDGELGEDAFADDPSMEIAAAAEDISAEDLGLADIDKLERKIPGVFATLDHVDPAEVHRRKIREIAATLPLREQEALTSFLVDYAAGGPKQTARGGLSQTVILFSLDELLKYSLTTVGKCEQILVFSTTEEQDLDLIIDQSLSKHKAPIFVFDSPGSFLGILSEEQLAFLRREKKRKYPQIPIIQMISSQDYGFSLQALKEDNKVFPRPAEGETPDTFIRDLKVFLEAFPAYLRQSADAEGVFARFRKSIDGLVGLKEPPDIALALLRFASEAFPRVITLIVGQNELIAERSIGIRGDNSEGVTSPLGFRIPLANPSIFRSAVDEGRLFHGYGDDPTLEKHLFKVVGTPCNAEILLLPLKNRDKTISLVYGDFGDNAATPVALEILESFARQAGLVMENAVYRKKLEKVQK